MARACVRGLGFVGFVAVAMLSGSLSGCGSGLSIDEEVERLSRAAAQDDEAGNGTIETALESQWEPNDADRPPVDPLTEFDTELTIEDVQFPQFVAALDKHTGEMRWKRTRDGDHAYSTPIVIEHAGIRQIVSVGGRGVASYDPKSGREIWWCRHDGHSVVPAPLYSDGLVYICTGYDVPQLLAIDPNGERDVTDTNVVWHAERGIPFNPSPLIVDDAIYLISDVGVLGCYGAKDGAVRWQKRLRGHYSTSPISVDGHILLTNDDGATAILRPGNQYRLVATNELEGRVQASPAVSGRSLFLRTETHLYRIEEPIADGSRVVENVPMDWPQFRGPDGQGSAGDHGIPAKWDEETNIVWKTEIPGRGWSSPVIRGGQVWLTTAVERESGGVEMKAVCIDRESGKIVHNVDVFHRREAGSMHPRNSIATPTPALDGDLVIVHFGSHGTACLSADGEVLWRVRVPYYHHHGPSSSPIVVDDLVILNCDGYEGPYDLEEARARGMKEPEEPDPNEAFRN